MSRLPPHLPILALLAVCHLAPATAAEGGVDAWPCWNGPDCSGSAGFPAVPLVDDLSQAKQLWVSEDWIPPSGLNPYGKYVTGFCGPVVGDGKVYIFYRLGSVAEADEQPRDVPFEQVAEAIEKRCRAHGDHGPNSPSLCDDYVVCMDANTGKTLWRQVFRENGLNIQGSGSGKCGGLHALSLADGRVYGVGSDWQLFCLDGESGELQWRASLGQDDWITARETLKQMIADDPSKAIGDAKAFLLEAGKGKPVKSGARGEMPNGYPMVADGVVAVDNHHSFIGFDAVTGERRWTVDGVARSIDFPVRWFHGGKGYFITPRPLSLIEASTGKVLWRVEGAVSDCIPGVSGDLVLIGDKEKSIRCYRISPRGAEQVWEWDVGSSDVRRGSGGVDYPGFTVHGDYIYAQLNNPGWGDKSHVIPDDDVSKDNRGRIVCLELATGKLVGEIRARNVCTPIIGVGHLLMVEIDQAGDNIGQMRAMPDFGWVTRGGILYEDSTPFAVVGTRFYVRCVDSVRCFELAR